MMTPEPRQRSGARPGPGPAVEERLRRREHALGWVLFGALILLVGLGAGLVLLTLPLLVIAFPLTLSAIAMILMIAWWRRRLRRLAAWRGQPRPVVRSRGRPAGRR